MCIKVAELITSQKYLPWIQEPAAPFPAPQIPQNQSSGNKKYIYFIVRCC